MKRVRKIFFIISIVSALFAVGLTFQTVSDTSPSYENGISIDSGIDGGAAGFAVLSGLALVSASITYLKE